MITTKATKGSTLSDDELDANWRALAPKLTTVTGNTTLNETHSTVLVDATAGNVVISLPPAAAAFSDGIGRMHNIKKIDASANTVTVDGDGAEVIDASATLVLTQRWQSVTIQSNGVGWSLL